METKKLFLVTLNGLRYSSTGITYGISYVVAETFNEAAQKVNDFMKANDIGFEREREIDEIKLIAEADRFTKLSTLLHL